MLLNKLVLLLTPRVWDNPCSWKSRKPTSFFFSKQITFLRISYKTIFSWSYNKTVPAPIFPRCAFVICHFIIDRQMRYTRHADTPLHLLMLHKNVKLRFLTRSDIALLFKIRCLKYFKSPNISQKGKKKNLIIYTATKNCFLFRLCWRGTWPGYHHTLVGHPPFPAETRARLPGAAVGALRTLLAGLSQPAGEAAARSQDVVAARSVLAVAHLVAVKPKKSFWTSWKRKTTVFSKVLIRTYIYLY